MPLRIRIGLVLISTALVGLPAPLAARGGFAAAPVVTSVTPNPLPVGSETITIAGTGFTSGALVYQSYGKYSNIQIQPSKVTATAITVAIYQGPATTATFTVKNPGSTSSNAITVTVGNSSSGSGGAIGAPVLTSVSPSPLPVGSETITIAGTGFTSGALVYQSYGKYSNIQIQPASVTSNAVVVGIYQGPATTATFTVKNPGTGYSNAITVPVSGSAPGGGGSGSGGGSGGSTSYTLTVVNGTGGGSFTAGTIVSIQANPAPAGEFFASWTGANVANPGQPQTTLTMPAANTQVSATYDAPPPVPFPVTTHPRLWLTPQDVPRLQSWATSNNVVYQGLSGLLAQVIANYHQAFPGAALTDVNPVPANPYPDFGDTQGYTGILSEENAFVLAFHSLIDPSPVNRAAYAQAARNVIMYALNQAALGHANGAPFRDPLFVTYNRGSFTGHEWPLVVDWIYDATTLDGHPILTAADKATIRKVFLIWANDCDVAETTGGDHPAGPAGAMNSLSLLPNNKPYRMASNNYYLAHARILTMMALAIDPADDPALNPQLPSSALGNTLRSYIGNATGAWLYEVYAMMGDPQAVAQDYGVPNNPTGAGFGLASGGLPPEGMLYGESFAYLLGQLLALQTAGFNDPALSGPQIKLTGAPVWDRYVTGYLSSLTPTSSVPASESWLGAVFQYVAPYGDILRLWVSPDAVAPLSLLALLEQEQGQSSHVNAARWFAVNGPPKGAAGLLSRVNDPWTWGVTPAILDYLLLDPNAAPAPDPRPAFPTVFYDAPAGRVVARTDWSASSRIFDYRASWISINHQDGGSGQFEFFRNGEWLTKEMTNYDNNLQGETTLYHNMLAIQNACTCAGNPPGFLQWFEGTFWTNGSQWMEGEAAGDPATVASAGPGYVYAASDLTNLFNRVPSNSGTIANVTLATRSIVWINNDFIVVYDRATTLNNGLFKKFNLSLVTNPSIAGHTATETLPSGQQLFVQTLLPLNASLTSWNGAVNLSPIADLEPTKYILTVQDPTLPADTRFLHVLQGADPGAPMAPAVYLQSGGDAFDGAAVGAAVVYFPVSAHLSLVSTTLTASAGVHTVIVTGLTPNTGYAVSVIGDPSTGMTIVVRPSGTTTTDAGGALVLRF